MRYWDDMTSKYGFNDGSAVPLEADACRQVYVRVVNKIAETKDSTVRAIMYDRKGLHNWCMILFESVANPREYGSSCPSDGEFPAIEPDEAMEEAIEEAADLDLDEFVEVKVDTDEYRLNELLNEWNVGAA
jgi:hypothetical protein